MHSNNTVHIDTTTSGDHDKFYDHNIEKNNCDDPVIINSIITENHKPIIKEVDKNYDNNEKKLKNDIAAWVISYNIPHNASNALLKILNQHTSYNIPLDTRTLLQTPRQTNILKVCEGEYFHFGLHDIIKKMLLKNNDKCFNLIINIDGLPLAKSSQASVWTILCSNTINKTVYLVSAYFGYKKPSNSNVFLQPLVNDLIDLINNGYIYNGNVIKVSLFALICDAPAKSFVLCIKGHTGFNSCTKCLVKGKYINSRICFPYEKKYSLRTNELFAINAYKDFQNSVSILNKIPKFLPLTNTPLDYMHLICLGVMKKIILLWMKDPLPVRLSARAINKISHLLILLRNTTPVDFVRRPRSIRDVKQWKATEFRNFLLYTGPVVLRNVLQEKIYIHFLTLHAAITILTRRNLCQEELINFAEALLHHFVESFEILYGKHNISHNVHNLLHICSDVRLYGPFDNFSAFRFENYMTFIKRLLRKNEKLLQQLIKRYSEIENCNFLFVEHDNNHKTYSCKNLHKNGPIPNNVDVESQYLIISNGKFTINCKSSSNNCCLLRNGKCVLIVNIIQKKKR